MLIDPKIKLLQIRKIKHNYSLIIKINGPLLSKGGYLTKIKTNSVNKQIKKATQIFNWKSPPRARIAVSFRFFSDQNNPPEIYNLIKYYLDLLQGPVYKEDRQIYYMDASIWRSTSRDQDDQSCQYIYVRRLRDYLQMLKFCGETDRFLYRDENIKVFQYMNLVKETLWDGAEKQLDFLCGSRITLYDMPLLKNPFLIEMAKDFNEFYPLVFDFGSLPNRGQSNEFKKLIVSLLSDFITKYPLFKKILVPIEFDVQVTKKGLKLTKDLDNIMITICKEFRKQVLSPNIYVNGYRVYVVDKLESNIESGIQVKLLPPGEIESYNESIRSTLETLEEDLEDKI